MFQFILIRGYSQDLILNGDFEDINICTEHNAPCSPEAWRLTSNLIPGNYKNGDNHYSRFIVFNSSVKNIRSYLQSRLADGLIKGNRYKLFLDISEGEILINNIGILLSDTIVLSKSNHLLELKPSIEFENDENMLRSKKRRDWLRLEAEFTAGSNAKFIIIGCFLSDKDLIYEYTRGTYKPYEDYYYRIDNVRLIPMENQHDPETINKTRNEIYLQNFRHPVPDDLFDSPRSEPDTLKEVYRSSPPDTILLYNDLLFDFDSYKPSTYLINRVDSVFNNLKSPIDTILVIGHTDNVGSDEYNNDLSLKRAISIGDYIRSLEIIADNRIINQGKGSKYPVASNNSEVGRYKNRRVEIIIKYKVSR